MTQSPYKITGPAIVSFSGGRSSGYMLHQILWENGGLPSDVHVCFANTGKEREETLAFVQECGGRWSIPIHWLEYDLAGPRLRKFRQVDFETASRFGEPFRQLIDKKGYLPNPVTRFCTIELKIRVLKEFALSLGWEHWQNVVGFRADEMHRVERQRKAKSKERFTPIFPMADAGVTKDDVMAFWQAQPFDLRLKSYEGNCDLCFMKGAGSITRVMRDRPDLAQWWLEAEAEAEARASKPSGARFRQDRPSYAEMFKRAQMQGELPLTIFDDLTTCGSHACTD